MNDLRNIDVAQADMRHAYFGGAPGIAVSALAWFAAALAAVLLTPRAAVITLFIGGMLIHPGAVLLSKLLGRPGSHQKGNPLAVLAFQSTAWLLLAIVIALLASTLRPDWFFLAMMLTIAGRYFLFPTLYGLPHYWPFAATLTVGAFALFPLDATPFLYSLTTAILEAVFAAVIFNAEKRR